MPKGSVPFVLNLGYGLQATGYSNGPQASAFVLVRAWLLRLLASGRHDYALMMTVTGSTETILH